MSKMALIASLATAMTCVAQSGNMSAQDSSKDGAKAQSANSVKGPDLMFAKKAAAGGMAEVEMAKLAEQNAKSQEVKDFAKKMVDDHGKANDELKEVAAKDSITLPADLSAKDKAMKDRLSKLNGEAFDKAYMKHMLMDHTKDVNEFKKEANSGQNADIKGFASKYEPTIEEHLKMAKQINMNEQKQDSKGNTKVEKPSAESPSGR